MVEIANLTFFLFCIGYDKKQVQFSPPRKPIPLEKAPCPLPEENAANPNVMPLYFCT